MSDWEVYITAVSNGCLPFWWEPYQAWCCGCGDGTHYCDQQCPMIDAKSATRRAKKDSK